MTSPGPAPSVSVACVEGLEIVKLIEDPIALPDFRESLKRTLDSWWAQQAHFLNSQFYGWPRRASGFQLYLWGQLWEGEMGIYFLTCGISHLPNRE